MFSKVIFNTLGFNGFVLVKRLVVVFLIVLGLSQSLHSEQLLNLGNSLAAAGQLDAAKQAYVQAIESGENEAIARYNLGNLYFRMNNNEQAVLNYRRVIQVAPQFKNAYFNLGKLYFRAGDYSEALIIFTSYRKQLKKSLSPKEEDTYDVTMLIADTALAMESYSLAVFEYRNALNQVGSEEDPYLMLAQVYIKLGDLDAALEILKQGESTVLNTFQLASMRAQLQYDAKNYEAAMESYSLLVSLMQSSVERFKKILSEDDAMKKLLTEKKLAAEKLAKMEGGVRKKKIVVKVTMANPLQSTKVNTEENEINVEEKVLTLGERAQILAQLEEANKNLVSMQLYQADVFHKAGYSNLAIYALKKILEPIAKAARKSRSAGELSVVQRQTLQFLESLYHEEGRLNEAFTFFSSNFPAIPTEAYKAMRNLLVRAYNENNKPMQTAILIFYDEKNIVDDVYQLLKSAQESSIAG